MTTATLTPSLTPDASDYASTTWWPWLRHALVLAGRSTKKMMRHPEQFFDVTLQPALFLLIFVYVLGGAISGSTHDYLQFVLPGIMIQTVLFSTVSIGVNLCTDIKEGVFDRFRALPIPRSAPRSPSFCAMRSRSRSPWSSASSSVTVRPPRSSRSWPQRSSCWCLRGACAGSRSGSA